MEKIGLQPQVIKAGKYKDIGSPARAMTQKEKNLLQSVVVDVHQQFIEAVANGRDISIAEVTKIADGRILTGRQAYSLNLVDQLGGLQASIDQLANKVGIIGPPKIIKEKPRAGLLDWILQGNNKSATCRSFFHPIPAIYLAPQRLAVVLTIFIQPRKSYR